MKAVGMNAHKRKFRPASGILMAVTIVLAILFLAPVFFAIISAFKSNGEILKNPMSLPTSLYLKNFQDLFAQSRTPGVCPARTGEAAVNKNVIISKVPKNR